MNKQVKKIIEDPILFIETFFWRYTNDRKISPFFLTTHQKRYLESKYIKKGKKGKEYNIHNERHIILECGDFGIKELKVAEYLYQSITQPDIYTVIVTPSEAMVRQVFSYIMLVLTTLDEIVKPYFEIIDREKKVEFVYLNSKIQAISQKRGLYDIGKINNLLLMELAFWDERYIKEQFQEYVDNVIENGNICIQSRLNGTKNFFYSLLQDAVAGKSIYTPYIYRWYDDTAHKKSLRDPSLVDVIKIKKAKKNKETSSSNEKGYILDRQEQLLLERGITLQQLQWRRYKMLELGDLEIKTDPLRYYSETFEKFYEDKLETITVVPKRYNDVWIEIPVSFIEFCREYIREPLFEGEQERVANYLTSPDPTKFEDRYTKYLLFWGKGSGKDRTISKLFLYVVYKLLCMRDPQKYFKLGVEAPIDIVNMATSEYQAKNIFFDANLKVLLRRVINPATGNNWFEEHGMDIDRKVQENTIYFPHNINIHSLPHTKYSVEGYSTFVAVADEVGAWRPSTGAEILDSLEKSIKTRFGKYGKLILISYKYSSECLMTYEYKKAEKILKRDGAQATVFLSKGKTWEINKLRRKEDFLSDYLDDYEKAVYSYECEEVESKERKNEFLKLVYRIDEMVDDSINGLTDIRESTITSDRLGEVNIREPTEEEKKRKYYIHFDLGTGNVERGKDAVGFAMGHKEKIRPYLSERYLRDIGEYYGDEIKDYTEKETDGVIVDMCFQIIAGKSGEINLDSLRYFVLRIRDKGYNIEQVSFDGWQSLDSRQQLKRKGIKTKLVSVDKTRLPYEMLRELIYSGRIRYPRNKVLIRELTELIDTGKKIDHPDISVKRAFEEGVDLGSKDVADAVASISYEIMQKKDREIVII